MYLKRVEIKGFKSFANKMQFDFNKGITAIVGPNGSGKSNIVDAVRWVLGEQSLKTLRGTKSEEVIFSGTETKKPLGFAEVSMILDNCDKIFNCEFSEIKITRCLYRTGECEYKINDSNCRLKDIYDIFLNTGIGKEGYSIIGQGKIDEILSAKPKDRRSFFEEATGISKSRIDLLEANKKLEDERQNLVRVNDILNEIAVQIDPLKIQSDKAKVFLEYKEKLQEHEINVFVVDFEKLKSKHLESTKKYDEVSQKLNELTSQIELQLENKKQKATEISNLRLEIEKKNNSFTDIQMKLEQLKSNKSLISQKILSSKDNINSKKEFIEKQEKMILTKKKLLESDEAKFKNVNDDLKEKLKIYDEHTKVLEKNVSIIAEKENKVEVLKQDVVKKMNDSFELKSEIQTYSQKLDNIFESQNQLMNQKKEIESKVTTLEDEKVQIQNEVKGLQVETQNIKNNIAEGKDKLLLFSDKLNLISKNIIECEKSAKVASSKVELLETMEKNYEGYNKGVKEILNAAAKKELKGINGTISDLIKVDAKYEVALQIAFGARLQNIVTDTEKDSKIAIKYLKDNKCGRATFMPLDANSLSKDYNFTELLDEPGYIGRASDLFDCDVKYKQVIKSLIKNIAIVDNIDSAVKISNKYKYKYNIVTLSGEQINNNGSITGGEYKSQVNLLTRGREISELKELLIQKNEDIEAYTKERNKLDNEISCLKDELSKLDVALHDKELLRAKYNQQIDSIQREMDNLKNEICKNEKDFAFTENHKMYTELIEQKKEELSKMEENIELTKAEIDVCKEKILKEKENVELQSKENVEMKVAISTLKKEKALHDENVNLVIQEVKILEEEKDNNLEMIELLNSEIERFKQEIKTTDEKIKMNDSKKLQVTSDRDELKSKLKLQEVEVSKIEEEIVELQKSKESISSLLYKEENNNKTLELEKNNIEQKLLEKYDITYDEAKEKNVSNSTYEDSLKNVNELKNKISKLGNVNIDSIEQYNELETRYEFLKKQRDDIIKAEEKLKILTGHLLNEMRSKFSKNLDNINSKFDSVFKKLFGGGQAKVELTDSQDVLEAGIEIVVAPPGKKIQSLMLLSGGERALVAISLLLGILELKPSPFCILDEIEAALDEANVTRYAEYIKSLSKHTQFLVITHRSGTMEVADYMYGITMEEKGISKMVSLEIGNKDYANDNIDDEEGEVG